MAMREVVAQKGFFLGSGSQRSVASKPVTNTLSLSLSSLNLNREALNPTP